MKDRLYKLRKELLCLSRKKFGEPIGMTDSEIKNIETGLTTLKENKIPLICSNYHVSEKWLRFGEGDVFNEQSRKKEITSFVGSLISAADEEENEIKIKILHLITQMTPKQWEALTEIAELWNAENKNEGQD